MSSVCISSCVDDARVPGRVRATYVNLYKWPESDAEFVRSVSFRGPGQPRPRVVESISCRQLYLRSYTFTRKETVNERTKKCIGKVKERVRSRRRSAGEEDDWGSWGGSERSFSMGRVIRDYDDHHQRVIKVNNSNYDGINNNKKKKKRIKEVPCAALKAFFRKLLFCSASVDVVDGICD